MAGLTLAEAERILQAAKIAALEMGVKMGISVVDGRGDLFCMVRMDGAPWRTPLVSQGKALASACFGRPSGELTDHSMTPVMRAMMHFESGLFIPGRGALPIIRNGETIGAVGCSGGTAQQDEDVAQAGLKTVSRPPLEKETSPEPESTPGGTEVQASPPEPESIPGGARVQASAPQPDASLDSAGLDQASS